MSAAREEILARVREAIGDVGGQAEPVVAPPGVPADDRTVDLFAERVEDYKATVRRCAADEVGVTVAALLAEHLEAGARVVVPPELGLDVPGAVVDDQLSAADLDDLDGVVTAARVGIAETGTIVLDHADDQGRRAITLVPDLHVCVVRADQVVPDVPDAVAALDPTRPLTWISGPSATSDIELDRVEGVHGPRTLIVVLAAT